MTRVASISALLALLALDTNVAAQHSLEIVEENGPADNRIDLVLMGDGYTIDQQDALADDTTEALE
ncbi:MAG: hypothetical protein JRF63_11180, partial [Deltaproteobacteria bacterium]|nr:hypothetical protein [Deltaproteobacteria bacterium]